MQDQNNSGGLRHKILTIVGIVLCVILIPILIMNCTLLIKGMINKDKVPTFGSYLPLIVLTDSMHDEFPSGSIIVCKVVDAEDVEELDIISFFDPASKTDAVVTHQVIGLNYDAEGKLVSFTTKGTNNNAADSEPVPVENLVGEWTGFRIRGAGNVAMFMQTTPGFVLCVFVPLIALIVYDVIRRRMYDKKHEGDKEELLRELEELRKLKAQSAEQVGDRSEEVGGEDAKADEPDAEPQA